MGGWVGGGAPLCAALRTRSAPALHPLHPPLQVSKMLGDTAFPQFYPTVFVLVTEMLDHFGAPVHAPRTTRTTRHHPLPPL